MRPYWRPPYGDYGPQTLLDAASTDYGVTVTWKVDTLGWNGLTADEVTQRCLDELQHGEIILMHVESQAEGDFDALPTVIEQSQSQGYQSVTVEQLLQPSPAS